MIANVGYHVKSGLLCSEDAFHNSWVFLCVKFTFNGILWTIVFTVAVVVMLCSLEMRYKKLECNLK